MSVAALLLESARQGVLLFCRDGQLGFDLTVDEFPPQLKAKIVANKAELIAYLSGTPQADLVQRRPPVLPMPFRPARLPVSFAQQRLWFIDRLGGSTQYHMPGAMRVSGAFDEDLAEQALARIVQRHEPLRTVFVEDEDGPLQWIRQDVAFALTRIDLQDLQASAQEAAIDAIVGRDAGAPFDLGSDLMLRASFVRTAADAGVFLFNMHHIASDGWSMGILVQEFIALYEAFAAGQADPLPPLAVHYADYAQWQRQWLAGEVLERQLSYWETQLADLPPLHGLPLDRPRPLQQTFNGAVHAFSLDAQAQAGLKQLALAGNATLFMLLHAAFALLLSRHSGSSDIVIGTPVANRLQKELEPLVGFFVNTLVLRADCHAGQSFGDFLQQIRRINLDAQANQDVPFEYLVERLNPARTTSHASLFQIMFNMNTTPDSAQAPTTSLRMQPLRQASVTVKFDLSLEATEDPSGLYFRFIYNSDLFQAGRIACLADHLCTLLRGIAADPGQAVERLPLLSAAEVHYLLQEVHQPAVEFPAERGLHELFEQQAARTPQAIALVCRGTTMTFAQLNGRANQLAHRLREQGLGSEALVGICMPRSAAMLVAILGVLKAGCAYVPIDPDYPLQRREFIAADSGIGLLLTQEDVAAERLDAYPTADPPRRAGWTSACLAYVIYTSGSTGQPKGVLVEHRGVCNFGVAFLQQLHSLDAAPPATWLLAASIAFDASLKGLIALNQGARLIVADDEQCRDPAALVGLLRAHAVAVFNGMPQLMDSVLDELEQVDDFAVSLIVSGDTVPPALWQRLRDYAQARGRRALNAYGPTETSVNAAYSSTDLSGEVNIGHVIANLRGYLLDAQQQLVPVGAEGELHIGGVGLARGYLNRPELTRDKFIDNPHRPGERLYRSGDRMRYRDDGSLVFAGRTDGQVKIRGYRIETGEIDHALAALPGVDAAVTVLREQGSAGACLVAYVTGTATHVPDEVWTAGLREALRQRLPDFMLPAAIVHLSQLPLSPNGKLDRKALPAPSFGANTEVVAQTPTELALAAIWQPLLGLDSVGSNVSFFDLGGHSLLAVRLIAQINRQLGCALQLAQLFRHQSIGELAALIDRQQAGRVAATAPHPNLLTLAPARGDAPPLFLVHPVGGDAHCYAELAALLDYPGAVYGLQTAQLEVAGIPALAQAYCEIVQSLFDPPRWCLGGWSMGGSVAFEMARQLREAGAAVDALLLFDSYHPALIVQAAGAAADDRGLLATMAAELGIRYEPAQARLAALAGTGLLDLFVRLGQEQGRLPADFSTAELAQRLQRMRRNSAALRDYRPGRYDGEIHLLRAAENPHAQRLLGWDQVAARVRLSEQGGNHSSMFRRPHVAGLASTVDRLLRRRTRSIAAIDETHERGEMDERSH